jgi:hypothetical protein
MLDILRPFLASSIWFQIGNEVNWADYSNRFVKIQG